MHSEDARARERLPALRLVETAERFLLVGHERPDGDVIGSEIALAEVLAALGKHVVIRNPDPPLGGIGVLAGSIELGVDDGGALPPHDVAVFLDFCELSRTGPMAERLAAARSRKLVVDHHLYDGPVWWDAAYRDPTAAATGVLVARMADELGVPLGPVGARAVFASLVTDTGWFRHSNTDPETLGLAARLVAQGVRPEEVAEALARRRRTEEPRVLARMLERVEFAADGRIALVDVPLSLGIPTDSSEGDTVLDLVRSVEGVEMALFVRERGPGEWRLSARARGSARVHGVALRFGGGGHAKAAGATITGERDDVRRRLLDAAMDELGGGGTTA